MKESTEQLNTAMILVCTSRYGKFTAARLITGEQMNAFRWREFDLTNCPYGFYLTVDSEFLPDDNLVEDFGPFEDPAHAIAHASITTGLDLTPVLISCSNSTSNSALPKTEEVYIQEFLAAGAIDKRGQNAIKVLDPYVSYKLTHTMGPSELL